MDAAFVQRVDDSQLQPLLHGLELVRGQLEAIQLVVGHEGRHIRRDEQRLRLQASFLEVALLDADVDGSLARAAQ